MRSLVIEDEPAIGTYLGRLSRDVCGIVDIVGTIAEARQALGAFKYDLVVVDRMLQDGDALDIVVALNQSPERPTIIMLTAKDAKESNSLEAQVSRLRKKLSELGGDIEIRSMQGIGYILRMASHR